jgi:hypothetical protein
MDYLEYNNTNHIIIITSDDSFLIYDIPIGKTTKEIVTLIEDGETKLLTCQYILDNYSNNLIYSDYYSYSEDISEELYKTVDYHISTNINRKYIWKMIDDNSSKISID